jgi:hypothetical protein
MGYSEPARAQIQLGQGSYTGKVVGGRGFEILVKATNGAAVVVSLDPKRTIDGVKLAGDAAGPPHVEVIGEILPEQLQKGMFVRFSTSVRGVTRRTAVEPVKELEVFTPKPGIQMGLLSDGLAGGDADADKPDAATRHLVVGAITNVRRGSITVEFPGTNIKGSVTAKVAEDAKIKVKINPPFTQLGAYARVGSEISAEGIQRVGARPPVKLLATNVQIKLPPPVRPEDKIARRPGTPPADPFAPADDDKQDGGENEAGEVVGRILKVN